MSTLVRNPTTEQIGTHIDAIETSPLPMSSEPPQTAIGRIIFCKQPERSASDEDKLSEDGEETARALKEEFARNDSNIEQAFCDAGNRSRATLAIILFAQLGEVESIAELNPVVGTPSPSELVEILRTKVSALVKHLRKQIQIVTTNPTTVAVQTTKPSIRTRLHMTPPHVVEALLEELIQPKDTLTDRQSTVGIFAPGQYWTLAIHKDQKTSEIGFSIEHKGASYRLSPNGLGMITQTTPLSPR